MDFALALKDFMSNNATILGVVSTRIHPLILPQNATLPALVYHEIDSEDFHALQRDDDLQTSTIEIEVHALTYVEVRNVTKTVKSVLQNYSGTMGDATVQAVITEGGGEGYDPEIYTYWKSQEYKFFIVEV
jgi:hypothetical protein